MGDLCAIALPYHNTLGAKLDDSPLIETAVDEARSLIQHSTTVGPLPRSKRSASTRFFDCLGRAFARRQTLEASSTRMSLRTRSRRPHARPARRKLLEADRSIEEGVRRLVECWIRSELRPRRSRLTANSSSLLPRVLCRQRDGAEVSIVASSVPVS